MPARSTLVLTGIAALAGLAYALADRRLRISDRALIWTGRIVLGLVCAAAVAGVIGFFSSVEHPLRTTQDRWDEFRRLDPDVSTATHFGELGSNR